MNNGLTAERMVNSFPLALQKDPKMVALAHSIANVLEQRLDEIDLGQIYTRIDQLPEDLLDILAKDFAVDWYDRSYTLEEKRKTIKGSFYVHRHRGTKAAVEKAISAIYPNPEVLEWFEYGGNPYHFKLRITVDFATLNQTKHQQVLQKISCYKNLRSHLDGVVYSIESKAVKPYIAAAPCSVSMSITVRLPRITRKGVAP
ncbi:phage tail protein I [Faecalibacterium prausnitzii]|uniref:phage tail protein I n=1 Tax=Faecalibacterium prausnitzii TaxID=853 RepID=UPI0026667FE8|nr:phage tail protein I [Faecalibacterium prausnitzii]